MRVQCPTCALPYSVDERGTPRVHCSGCGADYVVVIPLRWGHREYRNAYTKIADRASQECLVPTGQYDFPCYLKPGHAGDHHDGWRKPQEASA